MNYKEAKKLINWEEAEEITEGEYKNESWTNMIYCQDEHLFFKPKNQSPQVRSNSVQDEEVGDTVKEIGNHEPFLSSSGDTSILDKFCEELKEEIDQLYPGRGIGFRVLTQVEIIIDKLKQKHGEKE